MLPMVLTALHFSSNLQIAVEEWLIQPYDGRDIRALVEWGVFCTYLSTTITEILHIVLMSSVFGGARE